MSKGCDVCNGSTYTVTDEEDLLDKVEFGCLGCTRPEENCECKIHHLDTGRILKQPIPQDGQFPNRGGNYMCPECDFTCGWEGVIAHNIGDHLID